MNTLGTISDKTGGTVSRVNPALVRAAVVVVVVIALIVVIVVVVVVVVVVGGVHVVSSLTRHT